MFLKGFFLRVVKTRDCLVKSQVNFVKNDTFLVWSKFKRFAEDNFILPKMVRLSSLGKKKMWDKEKMLVTSISFFSKKKKKNVFKGLLIQGCLNTRLFVKELLCPQKVVLSSFRPYFINSPRYQIYSSQRNS